MKIKLLVGVVSVFCSVSQAEVVKGPVDKTIYPVADIAVIDKDLINGNKGLINGNVVTSKKNTAVNIYSPKRLAIGLHAGSLLSGLSVKYNLNNKVSVRTALYLNSNDFTEDFGVDLETSKTLMLGLRGMYNLSSSPNSEFSVFAGTQYIKNNNSIYAMDLGAGFSFILKIPKLPLEMNIDFGYGTNYGKGIEPIFGSGLAYTF